MATATGTDSIRVVYCIGPKPFICVQENKLNCRLIRPGIEVVQREIAKSVSYPVLPMRLRPSDGLGFLFTRNLPIVTSFRTIYYSQNKAFVSPRCKLERLISRVDTPVYLTQWKLHLMPESGRRVTAQLDKSCSIKNWCQFYFVASFAFH